MMYRSVPVQVKLLSIFAGKSLIKFRFKRRPPSSRRSFPDEKIELYKRAFPMSFQSPDKQKGYWTGKAPDFELSSPHVKRIYDMDAVKRQSAQATPLKWGQRQKKKK